MKLDLNCDVGELSAEIDDQLLPFVSSCNVCCGAHAGSPELIESTVASAVRLNVAIGAHPSWPDRENFGRKSLDLSKKDLAESLQQQIELVSQIAKANGGSVRHIKPHGALYHDVIQRPDLADTLIDVAQSIDSSLIIYGMADSAFADRCSVRGFRFVHEAFADRRYANGTQLRSRTFSDALISEPESLRQQLKSFVAGQVVDVNNKSHSLSVQTICLHGDTPNAATWAQLARQILEEEHHVQVEAP